MATVTQQQKQRLLSCTLLIFLIKATEMPFLIIIISA